MSILAPQTLEGVRKQKERLMRHYSATTSPELRKIYEEAINGRDRLTARIIKKAKRRLGLLLILLSLVFITGCETVKGGGRDIEWLGGAGQKFLEYRQEK